MPGGIEVLSGETIILPKIMGVLNVTPDSFSDGGRYQTIDNAVARALEMKAQGADLIDIGGESTRPYADFVPEEEECRRVLPVLEILSRETDLCLSIDTRKPAVARAAIAAGAQIWNDISALTYSPDSLSCAKALGVRVILMHAQGTPDCMQKNPFYTEVVSEVFKFLKRRYEQALQAGIMKENLLIDPGIGFGKRLDDNLGLLKSLKRFKKIAPVLLGVSRKSLIGQIDRNSPTEERLGGSLALALWALEAEIDYIRVHDVKETVQAFKVWQALKG